METPAPPFDIDVRDPRFYDDPWDAYRWLRGNAPLWWDARNELWVVSRHEDVSHISRHQELYSAAEGVRQSCDAAGFKRLDSFELPAKVTDVSGVLEERK